MSPDPYLARYYASFCACVAAERHIADCSQHGAQGIEAAPAAETVQLGSVHESPVREANAPEKQHPTDGYQAQ